MLTAAELHEKAKRATNAGRHERALAWVARARALTNDPDLLALLDGTAAYAEVERGNLTAARALCDAALARAASDDVRGIVYGQRAIVLTRLGLPDAALADFADAVARLADRPEYRGRALLNRGNLHLDRGDVLAAASDYDQARRSFRAAGLDTQQAKAEHNLGYTLMLTGDLAGALDRMARARPYLGGLSPVSRAIGGMDHAETLFQAGLRAEAEAELRAAVATLSRAGARRVAAEARVALARHLAADDPLSAAAEAQAAARAYRGMGAGRPALAAASLAVGCRLRAGRPVAAEADAMLSELAASGLRAERDLLLLHTYAARLASGGGDDLRAVRLPRPERLEHRLMAADIAAGRALALGRPRAALVLLAAALDEAQALRARVGSLDLATSLSTRTRDLSRQGLAMAVASRDPELVFEWSERGRAHASRVVPVRPGADAASVQDLAELRHLELTGSHPRRQVALRRRIREAAWQAAGTGASVAVCDLPAVRAALDTADAALVSHLVLGGRVSALVVADSVVVIDAGPEEPLRRLMAQVAADLDAAASPLSGVRRAVAASLGEGLARLDEVLVRPVADAVGDRALVLTPSDPAHLVPWGMLPTWRGRPVTVARSATSWLAARGPNRPWGAGERTVLAVAGPGLPEAAAEADAVATAWGGRALTGSAASVAAVLEELASADLAHLAAHGQHFAQNPLFSRLDLADGPLFGYDLDHVPRLPDLVVLSACDVGAAAVRGDDLLGLATALLHAGVRTVVAPVARVADDAARAASEAFHTSLRSGTSPAAAVAHATDAVVTPFVCFGTG